MVRHARALEDPIEREIAEETARLMAGDAIKLGGARVTGKALPTELPDEEALQKAQMEIVLDMGEADPDTRAHFGIAFEREWERAHAGKMLPGLAGYAEDEVDESQLLTEAFDKVSDGITASAEKGVALEKKLAKLHGGYIARQKTLKSKIADAAALLDKTRLVSETARYAEAAEQAGVVERMEALREEVGFVSRREREAQEVYRARREELEGLM